MRRRRHKLQVSTFPFLAVLLCAMGSLILVMLVMDRKAKLAALARAQKEAAQVAAEKAAAHRAEWENKKQAARAAWEKKRADLHQRLLTEEERLRAARNRVARQLAEAAARLRSEQADIEGIKQKVKAERGHLESEGLALAGKKEAVARKAAQADAADKVLARMTAELALLEQTLRDLKAARERDRQTYSVIPYRGRRGENRRPLYVECTSTGLVFHPDRKVQVMPAPSEIQAEVDRRIAQQKERLRAHNQPVEETPYLLLLVRPDGITNYYALQAALKERTIDYGYEFVDADWVLEFPADDGVPARQPWMTAAAPAAPAAAPRDSAAPPGKPLAGGLASITGDGPAVTGGGGFRTGALPGGPGGGASGVPGSVVGRAGSRPGSPMPAPAPGQPGGIGLPLGAPLASAGDGGGFGDSPPGSGSPGMGGGNAVGAGNRFGNSASPVAASGALAVTGLPLPTTLSGRGGGGGNVDGSIPGFGNARPGSGAPGPPNSASVLGSGGSGGVNGSGNGMNGGAPGIRSGSGGTGGPGGGQSAGGGGSTSGGGYGPGPYRPAIASSGPPGTGGAPDDGGGPPSPAASPGVGGGTSFGNPGGSAPPGSFPGGSQSASGSGNEPRPPEGVLPGTLLAGVPRQDGSAGSPPGTGPPGGGTSGSPAPSGAAGSSSGSSGRGLGGGQEGGGQAGGSATPTAGGSAPGGQGMPSSANGMPSAAGMAMAAGAPAGSPSPGGAQDQGPPGGGSPGGPLPLGGGRGGGEGGGGEARPEDAVFARMAPQTPPGPPGRPRPRPLTMHPVSLHGDRDWRIFIECRADTVVLYPSRRSFPLTDLGGLDNPLVRAVTEMIDRRQGLLRPGEMPFRPEVHFLVRPENLRTYHLAFPALDALPVPKVRQNLQPEDDPAAVAAGS